MFSVKSLVARMFARSATPTAAVKRTRRALALESLESREVPAFITWVNGFYPGSGDGQFSNPKNWNLANAGFGVRVPQAGDDVDLINANNGGQLYGFHGDYNTIRLTNALNVTLDGDVTTKRLMVTNGAFDQSSGYAISVTGTTVPDARFSYSFEWTGGSINNGTAASDRIVTGPNTTALIDPPNGQTLLTKDTITFANQARATIAAGGQGGTLKFGLAANTLKIMTAAKVVANADVEITTSGPGVALAGPGGKASVIGTGSVLEVNRKEGVEPTQKVTWLTEGAIENSGGILRIDGLITAKVTGKIQGSNVIQTLGTAKMIIGGGSKLEAPDEVRATGGKIATRLNENSPTTATIVGDLYNGGADVVIGDRDPDVGSVPKSGLTHTFGKLVVTGDIEWRLGVYRPGLGPNGVCDVWECLGNFKIRGGVGGAELGPTIWDVNLDVMLNIDYKIILGNISVQYLDGTVLGAEAADQPGDWVVTLGGQSQPGGFNKWVTVRKTQ